MIAEIVVSALLVIGGIFGLVGSYGLVKLPDPMTRLHAPTKAATLGVGTTLIASMIWFPTHLGRITWHELLITLFLFITAPVTGYFIAKAHMHLGWKRRELPPPPHGRVWTVFDDPEKPDLPR
ncbi:MULTISPECIES: Na+/H+ antiporter subunit G [unclassified Paracoccus (in: a-proteobacteria)]|uniref:Na+/H+ antiporter subunit G n=1 Tax=unclassified Paracoccus (in: a-proteobacteria) TaxID=2688777 RepID=UPI0012B4285C|nr:MULTISPECIES: Na+/H+ antiporter subunit G [unclassified Paracoccus (in: a-proteobacteria)]UXU75388.1 Na+/H+ antiporter subunit G [Paracoccus sp. SMMA_5]UXU81292.1 Na+/H+ antiporter subunit G [Paracoccus sp. SMMA_5_TC]